MRGVNTIRKARRAARLAPLAAVFAFVAGLAPAADADVQRQLQQREQQQMELRLKMQQQLDRATQRPQAPVMGLQQRQLERDQQQRLQQWHDQQLRATIPPAAAGAPEALRELDRRRGAQAGTEQLNRFGAERRMEVDPQTIPSGVSGP